MIAYMSAVLIVLSATSLSAETGHGDRFRVGSQIGVDVDSGSSEVRVRVGPLRIRVGDDANAIENQATISKFLTDRQLTEAPVYDEQGRTIGHIEDFVVDTRKGHIQYTAVAFSDTLFGEKLFAIPIGSMELDRQNDRLLWRVDITRDKLAAAPGFPRDNWPNIANRRWAKQIDVYYGIVIKEGDFETDFGTDKQPLDDVAPLERITRLIGAAVHAESDIRCGTVERLIFNRTSGMMEYIAIAADGGDAQTTKSGLIVVPMVKAKWTPGDDRGKFVLSIPAARVATAPRIQLAEALQDTKTGWTIDVDTYFQVNSSKTEPSDAKRPK